jgi:hypothetical protein
MKMERLTHEAQHQRGCAKGQSLFSSILLVSVVTFFAARSVSGSAEQDSGKLAKVVSHVIREGKDSRMNAGFAQALGLSNGSVAMKTLTSYSNSATNRFWVSSRDTNTIIIGSQEGRLGTFYSTDLSGQLKRVLVNDSSIKKGGATNIPVAQAMPQFQAQKQWWIQKYGND